MDKKIIIILLIVVILCVGIGLGVFSGILNPEKTIEIDGLNVTLPDGYFKGENNKFGALNVTNGTNSIFISMTNGSNVEKYLGDYKKNSIGSNSSIHVFNLSINNTFVYKTESGDSKTVHYWFEKNNKTYDIYTWDGNRDIETIVNEIIKYNSL